MSVFTFLSPNMWGMLMCLIILWLPMQCHLQCRWELNYMSEALFTPCPPQPHSHDRELADVHFACVNEINCESNFQFTELSLKSKMLIFGEWVKIMAMSQQFIEIKPSWVRVCFIGSSSSYCVHLDFLLFYTQLYMIVSFHS